MALQEGLEGVFAFETDLEAVLTARGCDFWTLVESPRRLKSTKDRVPKMIRLKKVKLLIFDTPPL